MRRRLACPAAVAVVLLVVGQLAALAHNATTRHVTCSEHGETLDAATLSEQLHACDQDHLVGVEDNHGGDHEDCAIARALHQAAATPDVPLAPQLAPELALAAAPLDVTAIAIARDLYRIAPKTSPPAAA